ncbi:hypothetical protein [Mycobacteroides chelonae]|uniref:hypothetical protein n=1 Tax=Mycobacteroides chelonae TaxID=1774 RepID=UPI001C2B98BA|nr:hypothetical protein [Mycobacteroides chelonae]MBV0917947.1 hypothetical protein [Mycobacteroides chelonae]
MTTFVFLIAVACMVIWATRREQPQRDAAAAQQWAQFYHHATSCQMQLLCIDNDYQHARQGSKALVYIYGAPAFKRDAWFWWEQVTKGSIVAVQAAQGWGPHTRRDNVLYIGGGPSHRSGVHAAIDAKTLARARRHLSAAATGFPIHNT